MTVFPDGVLSPEGYILTQVPFNEVILKDSTVAETGCGVIAIYNILQYLGMSPDFDDIKDYICKFNFTTRLGTSPLHIIRYLRKKDIYKCIRFRQRNFYKVNVGILLYMHKYGLHWTTFYRDDNGFRFLNIYKGFEKKIVSMDEFLEEFSTGFIRCVIVADEN